MMLLKNSRKSFQTSSQRMPTRIITDTTLCILCLFSKPCLINDVSKICVSFFPQNNAKTPAYLDKPIEFLETCPTATKYQH